MHGAPQEPHASPDATPASTPTQSRGLRALAVPPPTSSRASAAEVLSAVLKLGSAVCALAAAALFVLPAVNGSFSNKPRMLTLTPTFGAAAKGSAAPESQAEAASALTAPVEKLKAMFAEPEPPAPVATATPDPDVVVQEERAAFDGAILMLDSEPSGARTWLNGQAQGATPVSVGLDCLPGVPLEVEFALRGYERAKHTALCPKDAMLKLTAHLRKLPKRPRRK